VDLLVTLKLSSSLNTLPCRSDLDKDSFLWNTDRLIELNQMLSLGYFKDQIRYSRKRMSRGLTNCGSLVEAQTCVDFGGDSSWNDSEDFLAEFDEKTVLSNIGLLLNAAAFRPAIFDSDVDKFLILWLVRSR
jgi:hypothetical protein